MSAGPAAARLRPSAALLLTAACVLAYANGLTGAFTYDDKAIVRDNPRIRSPLRVGEIFGTQYFGRGKGTGTAYRPILLLSFALQWGIHGGDPVPFHAVNVLLHAVATLLLAMLLLRAGIPPPASVGAALIFAVHPIHVEAVTSIVGRGETQAAALLLGSLLFALPRGGGGGRRAPRLALSLLLYLLACLTKESAVVAPALLLLVLLFREEGRAGARLSAALRGGAAYYAGSAVIAAGVFGLRTAVLGAPLRGRGTGIFELENPLAALSALDRAANACLVFFRHLGRMSLPLRLSADESAWSIRPVASSTPLALAAGALLLALVVASAWRVRDRRPEALGFLFLFLAVLPTSNLLFPTGTIFAERLVYLPSAGFCLVVGWGLLGRALEWTSVATPRVLALAALALLLSSRTVTRNPVWANDEALFSNMVRVAPGSAKAHYDYAYASAELGRLRRALEHYREAARIYPAYFDAWAGRGATERRLGNLAEAEVAYAESIRIAPAYENGYFGLGATREDRGDRAGAESAFREGLRRSPRSLALAYRLALLLSAEQRPSAGHAWHRALAIEPASLPSRTGYAQWLLSVGRREEARREVGEILRRSPRYGPALELEKKISEPAGPADR